MKRLLAVCAALSLAACVPTYKLVRPVLTPVGDGSLEVTPGVEWNALPGSPQKPAWEEIWTQNGPLLETIAFVSGLPDGQSLVKQRKRADAQVPPFRATMSPADLVSMIEGSYRVGGVTVFAVDAVDPVTFLGGPALRMKYHYAPTDGIGKRGVAVLRVSGERLYLIKLDGVTSHYFEPALPAFEQLVASAALKK